MASIREFEAKVVKSVKGIEARVVKAVKALPIPRKWPISVVSGIFVIVIFWTFVFISMVHYPTTYNPFNNWMSNLGNSKLNPDGAIFFNLGCIICGIAMFPFFIGLYEWYIGGKRNRNLTIGTQISGFYCAFAMIMLGVFPEDYLVIHIFWAISLFATSFFTFVFPSIALYRYKFTRNVAIFGYSAAAVNFVLWIFIFPIMEWVTISLSFLFIGVIIQSMQKRIDRLRFVRKQHIELPKREIRNARKQRNNILYFYYIYK